MSETQEVQREDVPAILAAWQARLKTLTSEVKGWVEKTGWRTRVIEKPINDRKLGRHMVPVLLMERETIEVVLNPVSPLVPGAEGAVDLYLAPAYDDIATLYFENGRWMMYYSFADPKVAKQVGEPEPRPLSEALIDAVLEKIASNAVLLS
jgi:hypothetical protein